MKRHRGGNPRRGKLLYDERVHCSINEVEDIFIPEDKRPGGNWGTSNHHKPGRPGDRPSGGGQYERVMSPSAFEQFMGLMENRVSIQTVRKCSTMPCWPLGSLLTSVSVWWIFIVSTVKKKQLMKKIYPKIVDKPNFYYAIDKLTFSSDKNEIKCLHQTISWEE